MQINKIYHLNFLDNTLPDKCAQLIIADPPYFEVKGSFDFIWKSFDDYLSDVEKWAIECKRLLADNGTLFWYGDRKNIAYAQVTLDKYFDFLNHIYWQKAEKCQMEMFDTLRSFYCRGFERILVYSNKNEDKWWEDLYHDMIRKSVNKVQEYLNSIISKSEMVDILIDNKICKNENSAKQNANNILSQKSAKPQMITEIQYSFINKEKIEYKELKKIFETEYAKNDKIRMEKENERRYFNNSLRLSDHWTFTNGNTNSFDHDTVKPEYMTRVIIDSCSRPNDLVLVPFSGSGTECAMAAKENRNFIGFDIENKYVEMGNKRCVQHLRTQSLFS